MVQRATVIDAAGVGREEDDGAFTTDDQGATRDAQGRVVVLGPDGVYREQSAPAPEGSGAAAPEAGPPPAPDQGPAPAADQQGQGGAGGAGGAGPATDGSGGAEGAGQGPAGPPPGPLGEAAIAAMGAAGRLREAGARAGAQVGPALTERLGEVFTAKTGVVTGVFVALYVVSQITPAGRVTSFLVAAAGGVLVVGSAAMIADAATEVIHHLQAFNRGATDAKTDADLDAGGSTSPRP